MSPSIAPVKFLIFDVDLTLYGPERNLELAKTMKMAQAWIKHNSGHESTDAAGRPHRISEMEAA